MLNLMGLEHLYFGVLFPAVSELEYPPRCYLTNCIMQTVLNQEH